jgi:dipeptidase E
MRLYLSSFRLGDRPDLLVDLVRRSGRPPTVAVIANAIDEGDPARRREAVAMELDQLAELGFEPREVDLRDYDMAGETLARDLDGYSALWVRGGNVFTLRHAMAVSGADALLPRLLAEDALVYAGYSAGPCSLAPSLRGLEWCDDADEVWRLYGAEPIWDGLGVLDRAFVPHLSTPGHPETELLGEVASMYRRSNVPFWGLRDGQVLVVDGTLADATIV